MSCQGCVIINPLTFVSRNSTFQKKVIVFLHFFAIFLARFIFLSYLCTIAHLFCMRISMSESSKVTSDHICKKDVFERLSLWNTNLASSETHSRQMTTRRLRGTLYTLFIYVLAWANCVVYPVWVRQCESLCSLDRQKNRLLRLFLRYMKPKTNLKS